MAFVFRLYIDNLLIDREVSEHSSFTVGSGKKDTVQISDYGFDENHLMVRRGSDGWVCHHCPC